MIPRKEFLSICQVSEKLTRSFCESFSESDVIELAATGAIPVCARRTLNDETIYLAPSDVRQFDPMRNAHPKATLMLGFKDPDAALSCVHTPFTDAAGWETVESISKLMVPVPYVDRYIHETMGKYGSRSKTQLKWKKVHGIWIEQKRKDPRAKTVALSETVSRLARQCKPPIHVSPESIRKKIREIEKG